MLAKWTRASCSFYFLLVKTEESRKTSFFLRSRSFFFSSTLSQHHSNNARFSPALFRRRVALLQRAPRLHAPALPPHVPLGDDLCRLEPRRRSRSSAGIDSFVVVVVVVDRRIPSQPFVSVFDPVAPRIRPRHGHVRRNARQEHPRGKVEGAADRRAGEKDELFSCRWLASFFFFPSTWHFFFFFFIFSFLNHLGHVPGNNPPPPPTQTNNSSTSCARRAPRPPARESTTSSTRKRAPSTAPAAAPSCTRQRPSSTLAAAGPPSTPRCPGRWCGSRTPRAGWCARRSGAPTATGTRGTSSRG